MTINEFAAKILTKSFNDSKEIDINDITEVVCSIEGVDKVSLLKAISKEIENNNPGYYFKIFIDSLSITGDEFEQLKDVFDIIFVEKSIVFIESFSFETFNEKQMESLLDILSKKDSNGNNLYRIQHDPFLLLKYLTIEQFKKYYYQIKFTDPFSYREFPHHTRETVLHVLQNIKSDYIYSDVYSWALNTCLLTEEDLEPYAHQIVLSEISFVDKLDELKKSYSIGFWVKVLKAIYEKD